MPPWIKNSSGEEKKKFPALKSGTLNDVGTYLPTYKFDILKWAGHTYL